MENVCASDWDLTQDEPGYRWNRIMLGKRLGGELLGASIYELPAGERSFPFHFHHANEELLLVLDGDLILRTPAGESEISAGQAEIFRRGYAGAHQVINRSDRAARFIMFSSMVQPEIAEYPDSGNVGVFSRQATPDDPQGRRKWLDGAAERGYFSGDPHISGDA